MADNTRSKEEIDRLNARMAEIDKYLKDPTMKLGRGASGKFQFSKADSETRAVKMTPKMTATSASSATKMSAPTPKMSSQYDEDTRTALQQLGPRRGVTTESITKPSAGDAAKIAAYKADQERQARNVERGRDAMITAGSMLPIGVGAAATRAATVAARRAATKGAAEAADKMNKFRKLRDSDEFMREDMVRQGARSKRIKEGLSARAKKDITSGEFKENFPRNRVRSSKDSELPEADSWMGMKRGGKVATVMHEFKTGKLKSSSGQKVSNPKQAIAIAMSEAGMKKAKKFGDGGQAKALTAKELEAIGKTEVDNQETARKMMEEKRKAAATTTKRYAKGGEVGESKAMMKKEVAFMKRKGAPKSMVKHEEAEAKGVKKYAAGGRVKKMADGGMSGNALPPRQFNPQSITRATGNALPPRQFNPQSITKNLPPDLGARATGNALPPRQFNPSQNPTSAAAAYAAASQMAAQKAAAYGAGRGLGQMGMTPAVAGRLGGIGAGLMGGFTGYKKGGAIAMKKGGACMKKGGLAKGYAKGGSVRADGCATKGKTRCKTV